ncbi:hypothetical protein TIFTF001_031963 [Ficus carica]|uniref:Uncharacterized protein n=1 Tax=Ficus carica TaxID=3494 RepID=A0AA88J1S5_FICCA|nr:hypothetical protein TIFTF001_031963 [Ficus carica]
MTVEIRNAIASHHRDLLPDATELQIWSINSCQHNSRPHRRWWRSVMVEIRNAISPQTPSSYIFGPRSLILIAVTEAQSEDEEKERNRGGA